MCLLLQCDLVIMDSSCGKSLSSCRGKPSYGQTFPGPCNSGSLKSLGSQFFFVLHAYKFRMLSCVFWDPKVEVLRKFPELDARRKHHIAPCERESGVYLLVSLKHINLDCFFSVCFICSRSFPDLPCRTSTFMSYLYLNCQGRAVLTFSCLGISISSLYICIWHKV